MNGTLTRRQQDVLDAIRAHGHRHGVPPRLDDIGEVLGIKNVSVFEHVNQLVKKGRLRRDKMRRLKG